MESDIINIIKKRDTSLKNLKEILGIESNELKELLSKLINDRKIFLNSKNKYTLMKNEYIVAPLESCSKYKYINYENDRIIINANDLHTSLKGDLVIVEPTYQNYGKVLGIIKRKNNKLVCEVREKNDKLYLVPFNGNCELIVTCVKDLLKNYIIGDRVYIELDDNRIDEDNTVYATNVTKIGHFNDKMNDELAIAISKGFDIDFSKEAMEEVKSIPQVVRDIDRRNRKDLTHETTFTIDAISTKDMDDAIGIKKLKNSNYLLSVHIADVPYYVKPGTHLFRDALRRGTSLYLGDVVVPMIPSELSNGICSLNEGVDRLTKTVKMEITPKGYVKKYEITDSIIHSDKKMTYEDLNKMFETNEIHDDTYLPFLEDIQVARELSNILTRKKNKRGNLDFESSDMKVKYDDNDKPQEFIKVNTGEAQKIIENFMVLTNEVVASHFHWRGLPFVYRIHNTPDEVKLDKTMDVLDNLGYKLVQIHNAYGQKAIQNILKDFKGTPEYSIISNLLLRNMSKAKYSTDNIGHYALALDNYCHFTSPIRRFPDFVVHTLINIFINDCHKDNHLRAMLSNLKDICEHSSYKERQANDAESDYIKLKMAEYMEEHKDEEFEGIILDIDKEKVFIRLKNNIKCLLDMNSEMTNAFEIDTFNKELRCKHSKHKIKLGTKIIFKVTNIDIPQKEIYVEIKDLVKNNNHTKKLELK